jgi:hypothetical protein
MKNQRLTKSGYKDLSSRHFALKYSKFWLPLLVLCGLLLTPAIASALTLISQGFLTNSTIAVGSIVSLKNDSADYVDPATVDNADAILGVVINSADAQVSLSSGQGNQVQVVTGGIEQVLVSDINGDISIGDSITASPVDGVGMKATSNAKVVGIAQSSFPNSSATQQSYTTKSGQKKTVTIGEVPILINVAYYYKQPNKTLIPPALQNIANALAGKAVNSLPIIASIVIFIVTLIIVVSIIYALIHSSIISIGRNPMSQAAVYRNVVQLSGLVIVILAVAVASIYMVLTRL